VGNLHSIQGGKKKSSELSLKCRAFNKHNIDGVLHEEVLGNRKVWVYYGQCMDCGTDRIDVMTPRKCELISRTYVHPEEYDTTLPVSEARKNFFAKKFKQQRKQKA